MSGNSGNVKQVRRQTIPALMVLDILDVSQDDSKKMKKKQTLHPTGKYFM